MCSPHPFADFRLIFSKHICKIFLFQTLCFQYVMDSVYYQK